MTEDKNGIETFVVGHGQYLMDYPGQASLLSLSRTLPRYSWVSMPHRTGVIREMRSQMARDAFERGLGIIGLANPFYRVQQYLALRNTPPEPGSYQSPEWTHDAPSPQLLDEHASVEIMIEAVGFPIRIQEL